MMGIILDTHILIWLFQGSPKLSEQARLLIEAPGNALFYSIVAPWEIALKRERRPETIPIDIQTIAWLCTEYDITLLPLGIEHIAYLEQLKYQGSTEHHDPFDRIMLCQASVEGMLFLTHDMRLGEYGLANVLVI